MSKHNNNYHNYNSYSNNTKTEDPVKETIEETKVTDSVDEAVRETYVESEVETEDTTEVETKVDSEMTEDSELEVSEVEDPKPVIGIVIGCAKLNVRELSTKDSEALGTIDEGSEVEIDKLKSTSDFYKICTATGLEGFCMKNFIAIK